MALTAAREVAKYSMGFQDTFGNLCIFKKKKTFGGLPRGCDPNFELNDISHCSK
jgi:hypothetical protein